MRKLLFILPFLILVIGCKRGLPVKKGDDFNTLMGCNKSVWQFVQTREDFENIDQFKEIYDKNKELEVLKGVKVPKVVHFIWLGPNSFPKGSVKNVRSWVEHHPQWTFKLWTDRRRPLPHPQMELNLVRDFTFTTLKSHFYQSDNYAEKSDILRYEILHQEGGLYVDHDVECFKAFDPFHHNFDLYCGLEPPHQPVLSSSISICNNIIGVRPGHPVMEATINQVKSRWEEVSSAYPGSDKDSIVYRVAQRTFIAFENGVKEAAVRGGNRDIVFPSAYFNRIDGDFALFAHHYYASTWFEDETKFERNVRRRLISISRKNNQILLFNGVILSALLILCVCLIVQYRSIRKTKK